MRNEDGTKTIYRRTPESAAMSANIKRAMAITARLNRLTFNDADEIRALFSELIGKKVDESFLLIPPFFTAGGDEIRVGRKAVGGIDQFAQRCPGRRKVDAWRPHVAIQRYAIVADHKAER